MRRAALCLALVGHSPAIPTTSIAPDRMDVGGDDGEVGYDGELRDIDCDPDTDLNGRRR